MQLTFVMSSGLEQAQTVNESVAIFHWMPHFFLRTPQLVPDLPTSTASSSLRLDRGCNGDRRLTALKVQPSRVD